ncbi:hypothetical protein VFPPC_02474 [Pochonia chlamydosporia 170]|uniref:Uncharacterized protein n=1 Tax=Pochonia chlamydosporia 170 TaxID=1380566 RepID=A0A179FY00_METCM|nr:hypothetical protein VFPPC_02474 [Pochonia chlamydosporia 170]OAQ69923.1 hypothetical protein VFPPC_02474 [Pochonia chlamydosporia 170]
MLASRHARVVQWLHSQPQMHHRDNREHIEIRQDGARIARIVTLTHAMPIDEQTATSSPNPNTPVASLPNPITAPTTLVTITRPPGGGATAPPSPSVDSVSSASSTASSASEESPSTTPSPQFLTLAPQATLPTQLSSSPAVSFQSLSSTTSETSSTQLGSTQQATSSSTSSSSTTASPAPIPSTSVAALPIALSSSSTFTLQPIKPTSPPLLSTTSIIPTAQLVSTTSLPPLTTTQIPAVGNIQAPENVNTPAGPPDTEKMMPLGAAFGGVAGFAGLFTFGLLIYKCSSKRRRPP